MANTKKTTSRKRKPRVVLTRKLPDAVETRMMELFDVRLNLEDAPLSEGALKDAVKDADVLVPTITDRITADVIAAAPPSLKLIANYGAGIDHIDLAAAHERQIVVTNTPDVLTEDTADMTMALILAVPRRLCEAERVLRSGAWQGWSPTWMLGHR
ncbi:MAG: D-glycerate dehydrogenase, partial [Rhodospirillales bacterium]